MSFGKKMKEGRKKLGLTQAELAQKVGLSKSAIASYEVDTRQPDFDKMKKLAEVLGVSIDYMLDLEKPSEYTMTEKLIIDKYRQLDERGKDNIDLLLEAEQKHAKKNASQDFSENKKSEIDYNEQDNFLKITENIYNMAVEEYEKYRKEREKRTGQLEIAAFGGVKTKEEMLLKKIKAEYQKAQKEKEKE